MAQTLFLLWLYLLATITSHRASATAINHAAAPLYSLNASDLIASQDLESPVPYYFPDQRDVEDLFPMPDCNGVILEEATVDYLQDAMSKGHLTSTKIALCYMQRIYQTNGYTK